MNAEGDAPPGFPPWHWLCFAEQRVPRRATLALPPTIAIRDDIADDYPEQQYSGATAPGSGPVLGLDADQTDPEGGHPRKNIDRVLLSGQIIPQAVRDDPCVT